MLQGMQYLEVSKNRMEEEMKHWLNRILLIIAVCFVMLAAGCSQQNTEQEGNSTNQEQTKDKDKKEKTTEIPTEEWGVIAIPERYYYVNSNGVVNVVNGPVENADVLGTLYNGEKVLVTGYVDDWYRIIFSGNVCYVNNEHIDVTPPNESETIDVDAKKTDPPREVETTADMTKVEKQSEEATKATTEAQQSTEATITTVKNKIICIDAGHQKSGISEQEPNGPGSSVMKAKLATGTQGTTTGVAEHVVNLQVSLLLKEELLSRGYEVVMIRETDDCPKSNAERAEIANNSGAELFIRVHANGSDDPTVHGVVTFAPSEQNEYVADIAPECNRLSQLVTDGIVERTGAKNLGVQQTDTMTGINWCKIPVTIVEMGFMTNPEEDKNLTTASYQKKIAKGIADGIDAYYE